MDQGEYAHEEQKRNHFLIEKNEQKKKKTRSRKKTQCYQSSEKLKKEIKTNSGHLDLQ